MPPANDAGVPTESAAEPAVDAERGRSLLDRLRWTGRHVGLGPGAALVIRPRLGTADKFGQDVGRYPDDIRAALAVETAAVKDTP